MISPTRQRNAASTLFASLAEVSKKERPSVVASAFRIQCKKEKHQFINKDAFAIFPSILSSPFPELV
jgi:hypothetical protein